MKSFIVLSVLLAVVNARQASPNYRTPVTGHFAHTHNSAAAVHRAVPAHHAPVHHAPVHHTPVSHHHAGGAINHHGNEIPILRSDSDIQPDGHYSYSYETGNGIRASQSGLGGVSVQGNADWTAPDGTPIQISYVADENGYQATGSHIPTPPPIPDAILRSLEYIRTHPYHEEAHQQRQYKNQQSTYKAPVAHSPFQHNKQQKFKNFKY